MAEVYLGLTDTMRQDTDLVGKQAELELVCAMCKLNGQCGHRSAAVHVE